MPTSLKHYFVLPPAVTPVSLYTVPMGASSVCSSLLICNLTGTKKSFDIAIRSGGAALVNAHYIYKDLPLTGNDTFTATIGIVLEENDILEVRSSSGNNMSFHVFLQESL